MVKHSNIVRIFEVTSVTVTTQTQYGDGYAVHYFSVMENVPDDVIKRLAIKYYRCNRVYTATFSPIYHREITLKVPYQAFVNHSIKLNPYDKDCNPEREGDDRYLCVSGTTATHRFTSLSLKE